jgi:hypothetical protein
MTGALTASDRTRGAGPSPYPDPPPGRLHAVGPGEGNDEVLASFRAGATVRPAMTKRLPPGGTPGPTCSPPPSRTSRSATSGTRRSGRSSASPRSRGRPRSSTTSATCGSKSPPTRSSAWPPSGTPTFLIWAATRLTEAHDRGQAVGRKLHFHPHNLLKSIRGDAGGVNYKLHHRAGGRGGVNGREVLNASRRHRLHHVEPRAALIASTSAQRLSASSAPPRLDPLAPVLHRLSVLNASRRHRLHHACRTRLASSGSTPLGVFGSATGRYHGKRPVSRRLVGSGTIGGAHPRGGPVPSPKTRYRRADQFWRDVTGLPEALIKSCRSS